MSVKQHQGQPHPQHEHSPEADERLVEALREAQGSRVLLLKRLESAGQLQAKVTELSKQVMLQSREIAHLREQLAQQRQERASDAKHHLQHETEQQQQARQQTADVHEELAQLRLENASLKNHCSFLSEEVRKSVKLVSATARRSKELGAMLA